MEKKAELEIMSPNTNALISALRNDDISNTLKLIEMGENVNVSDDNGNTALMMAVEFENVFQALLAANADIHPTNYEGETIIHKIADLGTINELQLLLEMGIDLNSKDHRGNTPLHIAASLGRYEMVDALIKLSVKVDEKNIDGETPLHYAINGYIYSWEANYHLRTVKVLIESGADIQAKTNRGKTPLQLAQQYYDAPWTDIAEVLEKHGAK